MNVLRLVFLGSDPIALPSLDWLAGPGRQICEVVAVFTQPDRPAGRGRTVLPNAIKQWAVGRSVPVLQPEKLTDDSRRALSELRPDAALVFAYGHILDSAFLATPRLGTLNLHASLLPAYRGASPIATAIAAREEATGVSLMKIVPRLDAGPVADIEPMPIGRLDTAAVLSERLGSASVSLLARNLPALAAGTLAFVDQDGEQATYCRRLTKADGALDFRKPASELAARINGLFPWPGCAVEIAGQAVKLGLADACDGSADPGIVLGADPEGLRVGTGDGLLRLRRLQRPGGRMLPAAEFLRGFDVAPGTRLPDRPMPALVSKTPWRAVRK